MSKRRKQKIIYPRFQEMFDKENDPHWRGEFERASYGKFPPKITFKGGILIFSKNNKKERMTIPDDVFQAIENYKKFVIKNTLNKSRIECEEDNKRNEEKIQNAKSIE